MRKIKKLDEFHLILFKREIQFKVSQISQSHSSKRFFRPLQKPIYRTTIDQSRKHSQSIPKLLS